MFKYQTWCFNVQILDFISIQFSNNSAEVILLPPFSGLNKVWSQICFCFNAVLPYLLQSSLCGQFKSDLVCPVIRIWDLQSKTSKPKAACLFLFLLCIFSSIYLWHYLPCIVFMVCCGHFCFHHYRLPLSWNIVHCDFLKFVLKYNAFYVMAMYRFGKICEKGNHNLRRNSLIGIIHGYMCHLSVPLSCLKFFRMHYFTDGGSTK